MRRKVARVCELRLPTRRLIVLMLTIAFCC